MQKSSSGIWELKYILVQSKADHQKAVDNKLKPDKVKKLVAVVASQEGFLAKINEMITECTSLDAERTGTNSLKPIDMKRAKLTDLMMPGGSSIYDKTFYRRSHL